jgi:hypothetical protein
MSFKYYPLSPIPPSSASSTLITQFQALLNDQFFVATDVFSIAEESPFASGSYINLNVRINSAIDNQTGIKLGDDFKNFLFQDPTHYVELGRKFTFDSSTWLTVNTEKTKNLAASCMVRRANNILRWMLPNGTYVEEACILEYATNNPRDDVPNTNLPLPGGLKRIYCQLNSNTRKIKDGQRFLFGNTDNWVCFKIMGGGINNYQNLKTADNTSAQLLIMDVETYQVNNDTDDIINGIADYYKYVQSGSSTAIANIVITPNDGTILESASAIYDAHFYSGSTILSGSFVFSVSGSDVPTSNYTFTTLTPNTFSIVNNDRFMDYPLSILCSGSSGSRIFDVTLSGAW